MTKMIATKALRYGTRRLQPDEPFTARSSADARYLSAIGRARYETVDARAVDGGAITPKPQPKATTKAEKAKTVRAPRKPKQA